MNEFREARLKTGLPIRIISMKTLVPLRSIQNWELSDRQPPVYVKRWYLAELAQIAEELNASREKYGSKMVAHEKKKPATDGKKPSPRKPA